MSGYRLAFYLPTRDMVDPGPDEGVSVIPAVTSAVAGNGKFSIGIGTSISTVKTSSARE